MSDINGNDVLQAVIYIIPAFMLIVSVLTFNNASKARHEKSAAEQAEIATKLDSNSTHLKDMQKQLDKLVNGFEENRERISGLAAKVEGIDKRLSSTEQKVSSLEGTMHQYHMK